MASLLTGLFNAMTRRLNMADDKKNIGPETEKPGEAPQEKKAEPIKETPPAP